MGRIDKQVKVNGYRIELGEIENVINSVEDISDSVVIVDKQNDHEILHAYFVGSDQGTRGGETVKSLFTEIYDS